MDDILNIGIPCYDEVKLPISEMTLSCSDNKVNSISCERELRRNTQELINYVCSNNFFPRKEYLPMISYYSDDRSISHIDLSKRQRLINIFDDFIDEDTSDSEDKIKDDVNKKLFEISAALYYKYEILVKKVEHILKTKPNYNLRSYLSDLHSYGDNMLNKSGIIDKIDFAPYFKPYLDSLNPDKLALYIAINSLDNAKECLNNGDLDKAQRYLFYVSAYLDGDFNKNVVLGLRRGYVKRENLKRDFYDLLNSSNLKDINYDRDLFYGKNIEENKIVIDRLLNVKKIKSDEFFIKKGKGEPNNNDPRDKRFITEEERKASNRFQQERELFYYSKNPVAVIDCVNKFANYKGFLFDNGKIIADRVLNMNSIGETKKDAAYIFDASNFEELIKFDKPTLKRILPDRPIVHSEYWKDRVDTVVKEDTSSELKEKGKSLSLRKRI